MRVENIVAARECTKIETDISGDGAASQAYYVATGARFNKSIRKSRAGASNAKLKRPNFDAGKQTRVYSVGGVCQTRISAGSSRSRGL